MDSRDIVNVNKKLQTTSHQIVSRLNQLRDNLTKDIKEEDVEKHPDELSRSSNESGSVFPINKEALPSVIAFYQNLEVAVSKNIVDEEIIEGMSAQQLKALREATEGLEKIFMHTDKEELKKGIELLASFIALDPDEFSILFGDRADFHGESHTRVINGLVIGALLILLCYWAIPAIFPLLLTLKSAGSVGAIIANIIGIPLVFVDILAALFGPVIFLGALGDFCWTRRERNLERDEKEGKMISIQASLKELRAVLDSSGAEESGADSKGDEQYDDEKSNVVISSLSASSSISVAALSSSSVTVSSSSASSSSSSVPASSSSSVAVSSSSTSSSSSVPALSSSSATASSSSQPNVVTNKICSFRFTQEIYEYNKARKAAEAQAKAQRISPAPLVQVVLVSR